jgi:multidrug efflux pump subunit AcrB
VAGAIKKLPGVVDVLDGVENTISGPATAFNVDPAVDRACRIQAARGELDASAIVQGEPASVPVVVNDRSYTIRVRFPEETRKTMDTIRDTLLVSGTGKTATFGSLAVLALAIVLVFTVFEFGNFAAPIAALSSALLSTCGVFVALLVTGVTFNISSFMRLIMVIGIVAKNGLERGPAPEGKKQGRGCRTASTSWWSGSRRQTMA